MSTFIYWFWYVIFAFQSFEPIPCFCAVEPLWLAVFEIDRPTLCVCVGIQSFCIIDKWEQNNVVVQVVFIYTFIVRNSL